eukprot:c8983_g1_i2.p1 GENE.c8983_g1_i2~~c8983_g1_i2.p1  ORF type:complete len:838 (+),score=179.57 c8983_g1_i2:42-2555(+)
MGLFVASEMAYVEILIRMEAAKDTIEALGRTASLEFVDLASHVSPHLRPFAHDVQRCLELSRKLRSIQELANKLGMNIEEDTSDPAQPYESCSSLEDLEAEIDRAHVSIDEEWCHEEAEQAQLQALIEFLFVLQHVEPALKGVGPKVVEDQDNEGTELLGADANLVSSVRLLCGSIPAPRARVFELLCFRATSGNCIVHVLPPEKLTSSKNKKTNREDEKLLRCAFVAAFATDRARAKLGMISKGLGGTSHSMSSVAAARAVMRRETEQHIADIRTLRTMNIHRRLIESQVSRGLRRWTQELARHQAILHILNHFRFDVTHSCVIGEAWCCRSSLAIFKDVLLSLAIRCKTPAAASLSVRTPRPSTTAPSHFRTKPHQVLHFFQEIVNAYGVPSYTEINPAPFTVVTFPFLFGVMFGDVGHGLVLLLCGLLLGFVRWRSQTQSSDGLPRVLFVMGLASVYCGALYNETFAMPLDLFGSAYALQANGKVEYRGHPYVFGLDPAWHASSQNLVFSNSLKMKLAIVLGVTHMVFALALDAANHIRGRDWTALLHRTLPRVLLLSSIFGYLVVCIFVKWATSYASYTHCAPSVLTTLIDMFLKFGAVPAVDPQDEHCDFDELIPHQEIVQQGLLLIAFVSVPWMMFVEPLSRARVSGDQAYSRIPNRDDSSLPSMASDTDTESDFEVKLFRRGDHGSNAHSHPSNLSEALVLSGIHTVEFVLGTVSNTASYLRLWALSLAHSQLSAVFLNYLVLSLCPQTPHLPPTHELLHCLAQYPIPLFIRVMGWLAATVSVVLIMESLSAFLHALRLHWVEFQSKFYSGTGRTFRPFDLSRIIDNASI